MGSEYVGKKIKEWRLRNKMDVASVCSKYGLQQCSWYKWEQGHTIHAKTARMLHKITGIELDLLMSMANRVDKELDMLAEEYERTHPLVIDYKSKTILHELLTKPDKYKSILNK